MTEDEFIEKIHSEGGIIGALEYGLKSDDLAVQEGSLFWAWHKLENSWKIFDQDCAALLDEYPEIEE